MSTASDIKFESRFGVKHKPRRILSIVSNTADLKGFPVGFFGEEMTRAFLSFIEAGHHVDLASPKGGEVLIDTHSDPRTLNGAYADDLITLGFVHHAKFAAMLKNTLSISSINVDDYDAVWVAGGGGPLLTFKDDTALHALIASFYEKGKIVATICHGSSLLLWTKLSDGRLLADGKKWTGFTDEEEEEINTAFGTKLNTYTIQDEATKISGTTFVCRGPNEAFAIRDGRLITGQQQHSSALAADMVLSALDEY
ncbi:type 1 glutamine amidotransferase domain-containing protein [Saccharibacter sp. 17.LH.SD]|uniref:type 1 glutamine amidotransferase domain-containing protein n=1 Tax=Saccharibacter sp. 17.LH.SD TaxID=2689393 RepID=UPI00136EF5A2|nr:type 1 glutamine amidotransferase domain-containing protein [Saccharibacter sp. 17.LH.SD]MXV44293.1 type 1 glutamine amidotransferase domain-containing protein [Saccharibacter sp. 17.LH.SD]